METIGKYTLCVLHSVMLSMNVLLFKKKEVKNTFFNGGKNIY